MKKLLALALALVMVFSATLSISAATDDNDLTPQNSSVDVKVTINGTTINKYLVELEFGSLTFSTTVSKEWNPENYTYGNEKNNGWTCEPGANEIKITNHSDMPVYYSITASLLEEASKYGALEIAVANAAGQIEACEVGDTKGEHNIVATVSVSGAPKKASEQNTKIGTVTVALSKTANPTNN